MPLKELTQFDNYFGQKVDYGFLSQDSLLKLSAQEEENLKEGAVLRAVRSGERIEVGEEITSSGGQGIIYASVDSRYVIKLYRKEARTKHTAEKLKKLIEFRNTNPAICWPCDVLETYNGVFVGFIMPKVDGKNLYSLTTNPARVMRKYPRFDRVQQVNMVLEILNLFKFLHDINVIVGDVKLENVMFNSRFNITIIDIDSVQVEQFPCESSTPGYDAPEVILSRGPARYEDKLPDGTFEFNRYYRDFYRTLNIESFSLSVLIYRFLMNGNLPYDYQDYGKISGEDETYNDNELCIKKKFPYGISFNDTKDTCREKEIWSHFPSFLKEAFVNTFAYDKRYTDEEWIKLFTRYKRLLESGELQKVDPDCMDPFPEHQANYDAVKFMMTETVERNGFAMWQAVGRIIKALGNSQLKQRTFEIADILKQQPECIIDNYRFQLVYNIGVLKKVKCEYVL
jgi:DNA-binding helix-hairpin-helix protein with protein kinase domain